MLQHIKDNQSADNKGVAVFATRMRNRMEDKRKEGKVGWQHPNMATPAHMAHCLQRALTKGDMIDVANYLMMFSIRGDLPKNIHEALALDGFKLTCGIPGRLPEQNNYLKFVDGSDVGRRPVEVRVDGLNIGVNDVRPSKAPEVSETKLSQLIKRAKLAKYYGAGPAYQIKSLLQELKAATGYEFIVIDPSAFEPPSTVNCRCADNPIFGGRRSGKSFAADLFNLDYSAIEKRQAALYGSWEPEDNLTGDAHRYFMNRFVKSADTIETNDRVGDVSRTKKYTRGNEHHERTIEALRKSRASNAELREELEQQRNQLVALEKRCSQLQSKADTATNALKKAEEQSRVTNINYPTALENFTLSEKLRESISREARLTMKNADLAMASATSSKAVVEYRTRINELNETLKMKHNEFTRMENAFKEKSAAFNRWEQKYHRLQEENNQNIGRLLHIKNQLAGLHKDVPDF